MTKGAPERTQQYGFSLPISDGVPNRRVEGWIHRPDSRQSGQMAELVLRIGEPELDQALSEILRLVDEALPHAELGFYLHGSAAEGSRTPASDIDVLAVGNARVAPGGRGVRQTARPRGRRAAVSRSTSTFLPASDLVADPYVQLRRVGRFLGGAEQRDELPEPTIDAAARESVLTCCLLVCSARGVERLTPPLTHPEPQDEFFGRLPEGAEPRALAKTLG